jgi:hypothetical protein
MAMEDSVVPVCCDDGDGSGFLYYLETDPSGENLVGPEVGLCRY